MPDSRALDRQSDSLTRDHFDRVVTTHRCPECLAEFLGAAMCKGIGDGPGKRAHDHEVETQRIIGCCEPPDVQYVVALPITICARNEQQAREMAQRTVADYFPKRVVERHGWKLHPVALESQADAAFRMVFERQKRLAREKRERAGSL